MSPRRAPQRATVRRAAIYARISADKADDAAGVGRQETDCRALAEKLGWPVGELYIENDTSAYKRRKVRLPDGSTGLRVVRPAFRQMLEDINAGLVDALIGYDLDRIARDPRDLEDLIDVVELKQIPTTAVTGEVDLSTDNGIFMARMLVNVANKSSRDTSRRIIRKQEDLAAAGLPKGGGHRPFGYERDHMTVRESEAELLRQMADWILAGASMNNVARRLEEMGVPSARGLDRWNARSVHSVITKPRVAGLATYRGEILGPAQWPAILDQDTWERVKLALDGRATGGSSELKRWLVRILICGHCGVALSGVPNPYGGKYYCNPRGNYGGCGRITISQLRTQAYVEAMLLAYLSRPDVLAALQETTSAANAEQVRKELRDDEQQLKEAAELWSNKQITTAEYMTARGTIEARIEQWRQVLNASLPLAVRDLTAGHVEETWANYDAVQRREVARVVFPNGIRIMPATKIGFQGFDSDRIVPIDWAPDRPVEVNAATESVGTVRPPGPARTPRGGRRSGTRATAGAAHT